MQRPISPELHGTIDYGFAAVNALLPSVLGLSARARAVFGGMGAVQGMLNALTDTAVGVDRVVPYALHGRIEKNSWPVLLGAPLVAGLHREPRARAYWVALGVALVTVYNLTDWSATPR